MCHHVASKRREKGEARPLFCRPFPLYLKISSPEDFWHRHHKSTVLKVFLSWSLNESLIADPPWRRKKGEAMPLVFFVIFFVNYFLCFPEGATIYRKSAPPHVLEYAVTDGLLDLWDVVYDINVWVFNVLITLAVCPKDPINRRLK